ncbi:MAG TPA: UDP-N-acetyl-D-mannosamine dehydrogenase [Planctomycetota bacterium]|nr:UDP-N-acetyl-D-mannosamine dehydrogenase [Planctomycetota bacterium]
MSRQLGKVCVVGLGYIGLPTASLLATKGFQVHGVDVNKVAVEHINRGEIHIYEPDLDVLVKSAVQSGRLKASLTPAEADVFILAVPTPFKDGHVPDVSYVEAATKSIAKFVQPGNLVILESTSPVGTTEKVAEWLRALRPDLVIPSWKQAPKNKKLEQVYVAHCPERVLPGHIMRELVENDRVIGGIDGPSTEKACAMYKSFVAGKVLGTDSRTAEMCKLTENAFRDVNIAFANELSLIADRLSIDVWELIRLANHHPRVKILQPGPGVGGHCIAVDPWFIVDSAPDEARLIRTAREVNDGKPRYVMHKVKKEAAKFKNPVIACLGLSFKADIDDLRESPAVEIVEHLAKDKVGTILAVEPFVTALPKKLAHLDIKLTPFAKAVAEADIIVLLVNHQEFINADRKLLLNKIVIDTRGIWQ